MILQERIALIGKLGQYLLSEDTEWIDIQEKAYRENPWFIPDFIRQSVTNIANQFTDSAKLEKWASDYSIPLILQSPKTVGLVMAGNLPLVGFHDFLCIFISGHKQLIKPSSKDETLIKHLVEKLTRWDKRITEWVSFADRLKGCDAYIATGSNNSSRYFDYYFGKFPNIIRRNRTSVAVLDNTESPEELWALADDIQLYFGLGCRNITQLYVPKEYPFLPLLDALRKYHYLADYHKYKNNFDYHLALLIMGNKYYMSNDSVILTENSSPFSPVSQVHYSFYTEAASLKESLVNNPEIQCIVGHAYLPFGSTQTPTLTDYADAVDTMAFLMAL